MAKKPVANAADRPVMLSADSARRVGRMLSAYEGGDRAITPYVVPNGLVGGGDEVSFKYFRLNATLADCASVAGTEVTPSLAEECLTTVDVVPENIVQLHEMSYLVTRHNIARNIKIDTPAQAGTIAECVAFPGEAVEADKVWRIIDLLDCDCPNEPEPWCSIIGGIDLSELETSSDATYGLALNAENCLVRELRGCEYLSGQYANDIPAGTPEFIVGIDSNGCLCKVAVATCIAPT